MTLPKLQLPKKKTLIGPSVATVAIAFVAGAVLTLHQTPTRNLNLNGKKAADTTNQVIGNAIPASPTSGSQPSTGVTQTTTPTSSGTTSTPTGSSTPTASSSSPSSLSAPAPAPAPAPVTATSANLSGWSQPQPNGNGTVKYQYCIWGYSDGSTKQKVYRTEYDYPNTGNGSGSATTLGGYDCTVANAP